MREGRHKQRQIERKRERWSRDWEKKRKAEKGKARETRDENSERERERQTDGYADRYGEAVNKLGRVAWEPEGISEGHFCSSARLPSPGHLYTGSDLRASRRIAPVPRMCTPTSHGSGTHV